MEAATLSEDEATSTNFTCGSHFYEEVEDTKVFFTKLISKMLVFDDISTSLLSLCSLPFNLQIIRL